MGNSEVGHLNLGAGAVVKQDLARIDEAIADGSFFENEALRAACAAAREGPNGRLHMIGLVSDGGVHSGWSHLRALVELAAREQVPDPVVHVFTDGRDTLPTSGRRLRRPGCRDGSTTSAAGSARSAAASGGWTATTAGSGPSAPTTPWSAARESARAIRSRPSAPPMRARSPTSSSSRSSSAATRESPPPMRSSTSTSALTALASSSGPSAEEGFDGFDRGAAPGLASDHLHPLPGGLALPGRLRAEGARDHPGRGPLRGGGPPAACRRDREVRPRHLLLQRRPRGRVGGRGAPAGRFAARRAHLRPEAGDERRRRRADVLRALARTASASG